MKSTALILLTVFCIACSGKSDRYSPVYELFEGAELQRLSIDEENIIEIRLDSADVIQPMPDQGSFAGSDFLIAIGDSIVTIVDSRKAIKILNSSSGEVLGKHTFSGRGPGEYQRIDNILYSHGYFLIIDSNSAKVLLFDRDFNFIDEFEISHISPLSGFAYNHPDLISPVSNDPDNLILKRSLEEPDRSVSFHNRIISIGKQPAGYNRILMDLNSNRELLVASVQMPLLFFYDTNSELSHMLRLEYTGFDGDEGGQNKLDESIGQRVLIHPPPIEIETDRIIRGRTMISGIDYSESEILLLHSGMVTVLRKSESGYIHSRSIRVVGQTEDPFYPMYMARNGDRLFLSNRFRDYLVILNPEEI